MLVNTDLLSPQMAQRYNELSALASQVQSLADAVSEISARYVAALDSAGPDTAELNRQIQDIRDNVRELAYVREQRLGELATACKAARELANLIERFPNLQDTD